MSALLSAGVKKDARECDGKQGGKGGPCPAPSALSSSKISLKSVPFYPDHNHGQDITFNPNQCGGRPCIRGMRIRIKDVLDLLAAGVAENEILEDYPYLESGDIRPCLEYAAAEEDRPVLVVR